MTSSPARPVIAVERRQQPIEFLLVETGEVEIETGGVQRVQFGRQQLLIPSAREHQLVIGDAVRPHLLGTEMRQPNDRDFGETQMAGRQQPAMAGDHLAVLGDQQRHGPAVAGDRGRDLRHLSVGVHPRIALVRLQARDGHGSICSGRKRSEVITDRQSEGKLSVRTMARDEKVGLRHEKIE